MDEETNLFFTKCNELFNNSLGPNRAYCKKGCRSDFDLVDECKDKTCAKLCIKEEIGSDDNKWGGWSKVFSRAPANSNDCLEACYYGCINKLSGGDDKN
jgi:hypothetical protein